MNCQPINNDNRLVRAFTPASDVFKNIEFPDRFTGLSGRFDYRTSRTNKLALTYNLRSQNRAKQQPASFDLPGRGTNYFDHFEQVQSCRFDDTVNI